MEDKVYGVYLNGHQATSLALDGWVLYLYKKMLWNPDIDVDAALDEYCHVMFGPDAGPLVKQYYDMAIDAWQNTQWDDPGDVRWTHYYQDTYPRSMREEMRSTLHAALNATTEGTAFHARTQWLVEGVEPFFVQGEMLDRGQEHEADVTRLTPTIDGDLGDWQNIEPLVLVNNRNADPVSVRTEVYTAYDDDNLYIGINAEAPGELRAAEPGRERNHPLWNTDSVEIFLCAERRGDREAMLGLRDQYHQIIIDAHGNIFDGYKSRTASELDSEVNIDFEYATRTTDEGYIIEMAIPYDSLEAVPPRPGDHWIANFYRNYPQGGVHEGLHGWSPTLESFHDTTQFGRLNFSGEVAWQSDFQQFDEHWRVSVPDGLEVSHEVEHGLLAMRIQRTDEPMGKHDPREVKIIYDPPDRSIPDLLAPASAELRWRFSGRGLQRLRISGGSVGAARFGRMWHNMNLYRDAGWAVHSVSTNPSVSGSVAMDHLFFALMVSHVEADFEFEVDNMRLLSQTEASRQ